MLSRVTFDPTKGDSFFHLFDIVISCFIGGKIKPLVKNIAKGIEFPGRSIHEFMDKDMMIPPREQPMYIQREFIRSCHEILAFMGLIYNVGIKDKSRCDVVPGRTHANDSEANNIKWVAEKYNNFDLSNVRRPFEDPFITMASAMPIPYFMPQGLMEGCANASKSNNSYSYASATTPMSWYNYNCDQTQPYLVELAKDYEYTA